MPNIITQEMLLGLLLFVFGAFLVWLVNFAFKKIGSHFEKVGKMPDDVGSKIDHLSKTIEELNSNITKLLDDNKDIKSKLNVVENENRYVFEIISVLIKLQIRQQNNEAKEIMTLLKDLNNKILHYGNLDEARTMIEDYLKVADK